MSWKLYSTGTTGLSVSYPEKGGKLAHLIVGAGPQHPLPGGGAVQQGELRRRIHQQLRLGRDPGGEMSSEAGWLAVK